MDKVDLYNDCNDCDTIEGVKTHSNKLFNRLLKIIDRRSLQDRYTSEEVCKLLNVKPRTLDNYCSTKQIGYDKGKKFRYFSQKHLDDFYLNKEKG